MASMAVLVMPLNYCSRPWLCDKDGNDFHTESGSHGFSEILYAFTSMVNNNGSAFAGLESNTYFYNTLGGIAILIGRYW